MLKLKERVMPAIKFNSPWMQEIAAQAKASYKEFRAEGKTSKHYGKDLPLNTAEAESVKTASTVNIKTEFIFKKLPASPVITICGTRKYGGKTRNFSVLDTGRCSQNHVPSSTGVRY